MAIKNQPCGVMRAPSNGPVQLKEPAVRGKVRGERPVDVWFERAAQWSFAVEWSLYGVSSMIEPYTMVEALYESISFRRTRSSHRNS